MSKKLFSDLQTFSTLQVSLESCQTLPADAQKLLAIFGGGSVVSNEADYDHDHKASIAQKVGDLVKRAIAWVMEKIAAFQEFVKDSLLAVEEVERELASATALVQKTQRWKTDKITLSPMLTGTLAIAGRLDADFPAKMVSMRDVLTTLSGLRPATAKLATSAIVMVEKWMERKDKDIASHEGNEIRAEANEVVKDYAELAREISRHLKTYDKTKTLVGENHATRENLFGGNKFIRSVNDLASLPLPGGYVLTAAVVDVDKQSLIDNGVSKDTMTFLTELFRSVKPNLTKMEAANISFSGKGLDARGARAVVDEGQNIVNEVKRMRDVQGYDQLFNRVKNTVNKFTMTPNPRENIGAGDVGGLVNLLQASMSLLTADQFKTCRWALRTVRASLRYISASVEKDTEEVAATNRLPAPAV